MRFSTLASTVLLSAAALAVPTKLAARSSRVYITSDPFWGYRENSGFFQAFDIEGADKCVDLKGTKFDNAISSFGPDSGVKCIVYDGYNCTGQNEPIWYSGYADMGWNGWDNRVSSYECGFCTKGVDKGCL
ncbi:hypothetical protein BU26DRAFT_571532 [Trematosphaeria pertusa]|uniref:Uncharacterized protein n=1 Tax=Trematosphaeria pertusa TaxID=390896 RepID=A0A6A6HUD5_9PLEO|nr:uncharacterized protein BU26DRAFT_571532 [Trematosphaeria pertusa]KAF2241784.1 hypothetical protein BU26DRAFT_571532 [Trematosphaeria pertusa]